MRVVRTDRARILALRAQVLDPSGSRGAALSGDRAATTRHWAAEEAGEVIGCVTVLVLRGVALRGLAVAPDWRRMGVATRLVRAAQAEVAAAMWCNAVVSAVPFYSAVGWTQVGPRFALKDRGPHQRMVWGPSSR